MASTWLTRVEIAAHVKCMMALAFVASECGIPVSRYLVRILAY